MIFQGSVSILAPRQWTNPRNFNFDNIGHAILVLLEMLSLEGWTEVRDILEKVHPPWGMIYPHLYVFLSGLVVLTLLIGIIVSNYNESKVHFFHFFQCTSSDPVVFEIFTGE